MNSIKLKKSNSKSVSSLQITPIVEQLIQLGFKYKNPYIINGRIKILNPEFATNPNTIIIEYENDEDLKILQDLKIIDYGPQKRLRKRKTESSNS